MEFDESNGSQDEVVGYENVGDDEIDEALKKMSIGDIKSEEVNESNDQGGGHSSSTPSTSMAPQVDEDEEKDDPPSQDNVQTPTPQVQDQHESSVQPQAQVVNDPPQQASTHVPLVKHGRISKDHPIDQVIGSPSKGVRTRSSKHASFCQHYSFVSCVEPTSIEEALEDSDWVMAMQE